jgi:DNA-binding NarL/FixJ family response regulator
MVTSSQGSTQNNNFSVLIVSKPGDFRSGLAALLRSLPRVQEVHCAQDGDSVGTIVSDHKPEITMLDGDHLGTDLQSILDMIHAAASAKSIVIMGQDADPGTAAKADLYLLKGTRPERILMHVQNLVDNRK